MNKKELDARAAFQLLMGARVHVSKSSSHVYSEADRILALAQRDVAQSIHQYRGDSDYVVAWRAFAEPRDSARTGVGVEIVKSDGKKKFTYFKDYSEE